jgi:hypothetical protein
MVEAAHGAVRSDNRFRAMFERIFVKKGRKGRLLLLSGKLLTAVWHLLCNMERYVEVGFSKKCVGVQSLVVESFSFEDMVATLRNVGFVVSKG